MNDLDLLRTLHAQTPEPPTERLAPGRERLLAACRTDAAESAPPMRPRRLRSHAWRIGLTGALAAAVTAGVLVVQTTGGPGGGRVLPRADAAAVVLDRAAAAADASPDPVPSGDQYIYTEVLQRSGPPGGPWKTYRNRGWSSVDGTRYGLHYEHGHKMSEGTPGARIPSRTKDGGLIVPPPGYADFAAMPRDPGRLLVHLRNDPRFPGRTEPADLAEPLEDILSRAVLPPGLRGAAFRALAKLPGTTVRQDVADASGRHGIGLVRMRPSEFGPSEDVMILDPRTYRYLGGRRTYVEDVGRDGAGRGQKIVDWTAVTASGIVDRPGLRP